jgi:hypothetical protein
MLSESTVILLIDEKEQNFKVREVYDLFVQSLRNGKRLTLQIKAYDPLKGKFCFKPIRNVKPVPLISKIKDVTLDFTDVEKDSYAKVLLDLTTKVYVKNSNLATTVNVGFISLLGNRPKICYVEGEKLVFKKLKNVEDYKPVVAAPVVEKKRGRKPKKEVVVEEVKPVELKIFSIELADGSLILCDNLLQR